MIRGMYNNFMLLTTKTSIQCAGHSGVILRYMEICSEWEIIVIDREGREITCLVVAVRPSVYVCVCLSV